MKNNNNKWLGVAILVFAGIACKSGLQAAEHWGSSNASQGDLSKSDQELMDWATQEAQAWQAQEARIDAEQEVLLQALAEQPNMQNRQALAKQKNNIRIAFRNFVKAGGMARVQAWGVQQKVRARLLQKENASEIK